MKCFYEFEVIISKSAFDSSFANLFIDFLRNFNVTFELKGSSDFSIEYLVTSPSLRVANSVREWIVASRRLVLYSSSCKDRTNSLGWSYGVIRQVESDEIE